MRKILVHLFMVGLLVFIAAGAFAQDPAFFLEIETTDEAGLAMKDSVENIVAGDAVYLSLYATNVSGMIGYDVRINLDRAKYDENQTEFIYDRDTETNQNPLVPDNSSIFGINKFITNSTGDYYSISVTSSASDSGIDVTDWTFLGRLKLVTASSWQLPGDFQVFSFDRAQVLTNPGIVLSDVADVNQAYINIVTDVDEEEGGAVIPSSYRLKQNYPNPFNPTTTIPFELKAAGNVRITVFNVLGQKVTEIVNDYYTAGTYTVKFNARGLSSGVYFYRMEVNDFSTMNKLLLLK